jgi:chromosome segregation ATPase
MLPRMTVEPDIPHKLGQMRHDLDDLYELVSQGQARITGTLMRHHNRLEELQQTLDLHNGRLDRIEDNQRRHAERLDGIESRLDSIEDNQRRQFDQLSAQMTEILGVLRGSAVVADSASGSTR